jgi:hypothetical protein
MHAIDTYDEELNVVQQLKFDHSLSIACQSTLYHETWPFPSHAEASTHAYSLPICVCLVESLSSL